MIADGNIPSSVMASLVKVASEATGMDVSIFRKNHLVKRFEALAAHMGYKSLSMLNDNLRANTKIKHEICNFIPLGYTEFFRDKDAFELVFEYFASFPARFQNENAFRVLSAGCGSGEEAYSIASTALLALSEFKGKVFVEGVDICAERIANANLGNCKIHSNFDPIPEKYATYFKIDVKNATIMAKPSLKNILKFTAEDFFNEDFCSKRKESIHLAACRYILSVMTPIAIRNNLPYLVSTLVPGGFLWLAVGEFVENPADFGLEHLDANIYRRI